MSDESFLENLWDRILSRESEQIRDAYVKLQPNEKVAVITHLEKMVSEPGWHPEQVLSARAALDVLKK